jgi:hypothetical protein
VKAMANSLEVRLCGAGNVAVASLDEVAADLREELGSSRGE